MAWPMVVAGIASGLGSMMGGKAANKTKTTNTNQTTRTTPYGGSEGYGYLNNLLGQGSELFFNTPRPDVGPSSDMTDTYNTLSRLANNPQGGLGLGGALQAHGGGGNSTGGGGDPRPGGSGNGLMNVQDFGRYLANYQVVPNEYMQRVLSGDYLAQGNPYQQSMLNAMQNAYEQSLPSIDARFAQSGRFGSGALAGAHVLANERYNTGVENTLGQLWDSERNRMNEALGMLSQETASARNTMGGVQQSEISGAAQRAAAQTAADAQRAAARMGLQAQMARLGLDRQQAQFGNLMSLYGLAENQQNASIRNDMLPYDLLQKASDFGLPLLSNFGTTNTTGTNITPGLGVNPWGSGLASGLGTWASLAGAYGTSTASPGTGSKGRA